MRFIPVLLVSVALATSAGCFGKEDGGDDPPTSTTPTGTTPPTGATPTGATPTSPTTGNNNTPPAKPAPREVFTGSAGFEQPPAVPPADPTQPSPPQDNPFSVPALYTTLTLNVTWALGAAPVGAAATELKIQMLDPTGAPLGTPCVAPSGPHPAAPAACTQPATIPATGGEYIVQYTGSGTLTATVSIVAS